MLVNIECTKKPLVSTRKSSISALERVRSVVHQHALSIFACYFILYMFSHAIFKLQYRLAGSRSYNLQKFKANEFPHIFWPLVLEGSTLIIILQSNGTALLM